MDKHTKELISKGRYGDTILAHISPPEALLLKFAGGSGTINPDTGLPEFFLGGFLDTVKDVVSTPFRWGGDIAEKVGLPAWLGQAGKPTFSAISPPHLKGVETTSFTVSKKPPKKNSGKPVSGFMVPDPPANFSKSASDGDIWARMVSPYLPFEISSLVCLSISLPPIASNPIHISMGYKA